MSKINDISVVKKGIFALAMVAVVGTTTSAYALTNQNSTQNASTSGYGTDGSDSIAAIDAFGLAFDGRTSEFRQQVSELATTARGALESTGGSGNVDAFLAGFDTANSTYDSRLDKAASDFRTNVAAAANKAENKDQFIDAFNRAKAEYFNEVEQSKNDFAAAVSNLGDNGNRAKDVFIGGYNEAKGSYGNDIEVLKNDFAAKIG